RVGSDWSSDVWSSDLKMANEFHTRLFVTASTILPTAASLDATCDFGAYAPGAVPLVWFSPSDMNIRFGTVPSRSICWNSSMNRRSEERRVGNRSGTQG